MSIQEQKTDPSAELLYARDVLPSEAAPAVEPANIPNNGWFEYHGDTDTALIFVHGFLSDSQGCWTSPSNVFWPTLVKNDERLQSVSVFLGGYHTAIDSLNYGIKECANELRNSLVARQSNGRRSVIDYKTLVFVCHSLGGIVTRYMLDAYRNMFKEKVVGLVLVASPSLGSRYANIAAGLASLFGNRVAKQLRHEAELVADLDDRFRQLLGEKLDFRIVGVELTEDRGPFHSWLTSRLPPIVSRTSSSRYFGPTNIIPKTDHSSIAKPDSTSHLSHQNLVDFLCSKMDLSAPVGRNFKKIDKLSLLAQEVIDERNLTKNILFDIFKPDCAPYYLNRNLDIQIARHMQVGNVWLSGESGVGKTSALRSYLNSENVASVEVPLAHCIGKLDATRCIQEIMETIASDSPELVGGRSLVAVAALLAKRAKSGDIVLFFDEVPICKENSNEISNFIEFISNLSTLLRQRESAAGRTRILVASIENPLCQGAILTQKSREQINFIKAPVWSDIELRELYFKLVLVAPRLEIDENMLLKVVDASDGSPRFFKTFFRNKVVSESSSDEDSLVKTVEQYAWMSKV